MITQPHRQQSTDTQSPREWAASVNGHTKRALLAIIVVVMSISTSGCFTSTYDARVNYESDLVRAHATVLSDEVSAIAIIAGKDRSHKYAFLGKKYSYIVTTGGKKLVEVAQSSIAKHITVLITSHRWSGLELVGNHYNGQVRLSITVKTNDESSIDTAKRLGFKLVAYDNSNTKYELPYSTYYLIVPVAGHLSNPVKFESDLSKPIPVKFWNGASHVRHAGGHAVAVALDIITAPAQVLGVLGGITVLSIACATYNPKKHDNQPCIE